MSLSPSTFLKRSGHQTHVSGEVDQYQLGQSHVHNQPLSETIANGEPAQEAWPSTSPEKKRVGELGLPI